MTGQHAEKLWTAFLITLTFVALASSVQLVLANPEGKNWNWITKQPSGVSGVSLNANLKHGE